MSDTPSCPQCHKPLEKVRYPSDSMFNRYQWESMRAGDWWCETCPDNGRGRSGAYFWQKEIEAPAPPADREREIDPMEYSHPTEQESQLAELWLRAYAKRTRLHHWTLDQLLSQKYQVAAFAHWYTGNLAAHVLQDAMERVEDALLKQYTSLDIAERKTSCDLALSVLKQMKGITPRGEK